MKETVINLRGLIWYREYNGGFSFCLSKQLNLTGYQPVGREVDNSIMVQTGLLDCGLSRCKTKLQVFWAATERFADSLNLSACSRKGWQGCSKARKVPVMPSPSLLASL